MDSITSRVGAEAQQRRRSVWRESANNLTTMKRDGVPETVSLNHKSCCVACAKHFFFVVGTQHSGRRPDPCSGAASTPSGGGGQYGGGEGHLKQ